MVSVTVFVPIYLRHKAIVSKNDKLAEDYIGQAVKKFENGKNYEALAILENAMKSGTLDFDNMSDKTRYNFFKTYQGLLYNLGEYNKFR
ncbi:MAG: hypothetical protein M1269_10440 [Chloroflexi bacterium]|nr:hypothetical protein [Chloroflexota bacterium]